MRLAACKRWLVGSVLVLAMMAAGCGSDDDSSSATSAPSDGTTETDGQPTDEEATDEETTDEDGDEEGVDEEATDEEGADEEEDEAATDEDGADEDGEVEDGADEEDDENGADEDGEVEEPEFTEEDFEDFDAAVFDNPTVVDNQYFPLVPGTQHVYEGTALEDDELIERMVISIVTDLTKEINGVETVVVWERDFNDGLLLESEIAFFAQDNDGNVWHFGQYRETYDEDEFVGGRIWLVDLPEGARAGIIMPADPQANGESFSQGYAPSPFNWTDRATVGEVGAETCIADDQCFENVLIIEETDSEDPGAFQLKFYAPGVGNVEVGFRGPDPEEEEMVLTEDIVLEGADLDAAREDALALEQRGYMYSLTTPAAPRG